MYKPVTLSTLEIAFDVQFYFDEITLFFFLLLCCYILKIIDKAKVIKVAFMFSFKSFIILALKFKSFINFALIFVYSIRDGSNFIHFM